MAKQPKGELAVVGFDYSLVGDAADEVRATAEKIRQKVQRTIESIIEVGQELLAVKDSVGHGHFGGWLRAEFGWTERTAQNFMSVAERFGNTKLVRHGRSEMSDRLPVQGGFVENVSTKSDVPKGGRDGGRGRGSML